AAQARRLGEGALHGLAQERPEVRLVPRSRRADRVSPRTWPRHQGLGRRRRLDARGRQAQAHHPRASRLRRSRGGRRDPSGRHPHLRSGIGRDRREMTRLLDGIRVIDAANFIAGPVATTIMADFGADVIKVEPPTGDVYRVRGAGYPLSPYNYPWFLDNRTKRSVAIDLRTGDGQDLLHRLVREVDVFVTNAPLDSRARLRVRYEDLAPLNTRLVYASISAYGETGEAAGRPGLHGVALWARTGLM